MIIGIDFDNTIVCYDELFRDEALRRALIPPETPARKEAVRDYLRRQEQEDQWTELQGYIYGPGIIDAKPYPGLFEWLCWCKNRGIKTCIISHKTRFPYLGTQFDLHQSARNWLYNNGLFNTSATGLQEDDVSFALTKAEKLCLIDAKKCDYFIDDLPEFLSEPLFPASTKKLLFDPNNIYSDGNEWQRVGAWVEIMNIMSSIAAND